MLKHRDATTAARSAQLLAEVAELRACLRIEMHRLDNELGALLDPKHFAVRVAFRRAAQRG